jgi:hypothetical protein
MSCNVEHDAGAYVLGALSPDERVAFERHLTGCETCARSVSEFAGLPGLLARVPVEIVEPTQPPLPVPDTLLPALVRRARSSSRRRTWVTTGLVAAAAAVAIGAVGVAVLGDDEPSSAPPTATPSTAPPELMQPIGDEPVSGWVSLTQVGWGTRLDLTCKYSKQSNSYEGTDGATYVMYVTRADGITERVASWKALPGKTMQLAAATAASADDITMVEVQASDGHTVLRLG